MNRIPKQATGVFLQAYTRIGGNNTFPPPLLAILQTDGSFIARTRMSRVAMILQPANKRGIYKNMFEIEKAASSTETEWASIAHGLQFALEKSEEAVAIENDNLGVVASLMLPRKPLKQDYARHYQNEIYTLTKQTSWTGIRWIPRGRNAADILFRPVA